MSELVIAQYNIAFAAILNVQHGDATSKLSKPFVTPSIMPHLSPPRFRQYPLLSYIRLPTILSSPRRCSSRPQRSSRSTITSHLNYPPSLNNIPFPSMMLFPMPLSMPMRLTPQKNSLIPQIHRKRHRRDAQAGKRALEAVPPAEGACIPPRFPRDVSVPSTLLSLSSPMKEGYGCGGADGGWGGADGLGWG